MICGDADDIEAEYRRRPKTYGSYYVTKYNKQLYIIFNVCGYNIKYHYIDPKFHNFIISKYEKNHFDDLYSDYSNEPPKKHKITETTLVLSSVLFDKSNVSDCEFSDYYITKQGLGGIYEPYTYNNKMIDAIIQ